MFTANSWYILTLRYPKPIRTVQKELLQTIVDYIAHRLAALVAISPFVAEPLLAPRRSSILYVTLHIFVERNLPVLCFALCNNRS